MLYKNIFKHDLLFVLILSRLKINSKVCRHHDQHDDGHDGPHLQQPEHYGGVVGSV